jgi:hypothetical protein
LKIFRQETNQELPIFNEIRQIFSDICDKYANQKLNVSLRSTGNRVTFKQDLISKENQFKKQQQNNYNNNNNNNHKQTNSNSMNNNNYNNKNNNQLNKSLENSRTLNESEETDDDVSLSNALESEDEDDTEPTKSIINDASQISTVLLSAHNQNEMPRRSVSPRKPNKKLANSFNQEELSDLESIRLLKKLN